MSEACYQDGLLMLLHASEVLNDIGIDAYVQSDRWDSRPATSRRSYDDGPSTFSSPYPSSPISRRSGTSTRRAHLRTCMESLKERLLFDTEVPRITMLTVLRKATSTIQMLRQKNDYLEACEIAERQRFNSMLKRKLNIRKKMDSKRSRLLKLQGLRDRNRSYSECSALTTSSEESELDYATRHLASSMYSILSNCTPRVVGPTDNQYTSSYMDPAVSSAKTAASYAVPGIQLSYSKLPRQSSPVAVTELSPTDGYDASGSDSGFEEVVTVTTTTDDPVTEKMVPPVISNIEEVYAFQGGYKVY